MLNKDLMIMEISNIHSFISLIIRYSNIDEMWKVELENQSAEVQHRVGSKDNWYNKAAEYWEV